MPERVELLTFERVADVEYAAAAAVGAIAGEGGVAHLACQVVDMPPTPPLLPERVELLTSSVPLLNMPPPAKGRYCRRGWS